MTSIEEAGSFNSAHKSFIREQWNKPLLKFLSRKTSDRLLYLGLPSPKAEDILEWIEYIKVVIAFQCRDYPEPSSENQDRGAIDELNDILNDLERKSKLDNYIVFDGYLEEVVLRGYDNSPTRINFSVENFVTLYNLDFCNKISSPIKYIDGGGIPQIAYKIEAINKLLQIQQALRKSSNKFILFLTVQCSYDGAELDHFIRLPPNEEIKEYISKCKTLSGHIKNARIVRLFFAYQIKQQLEAFGFSAKILPSVYYTGLKGVTLLHFSVFGIAQTKPSATVPSFQTLRDIINQKFISIDDSKFINQTKAFDSETDVELDPVKLFAESETYRSLW